MNKKSAFGIIFLTTFLDLLGFGLIIPILPKLSLSLGATELQAGLIASVYPLMNFAFSHFWGSLSDKHGRRPIILISVLITAIAYIGFSQSHALWILIASRILAGIGSANLGAAQAYIADISTPEERTKSMAMIGAAFGLGFICGPPIGGWLKSDFGLQALGLTAAGLSFANFVFAYFLLPESLQQKKQIIVRQNPIKAILAAMKKKELRPIFWISFLFTIAFSMMQITAVWLWGDYSGFSEKQIGGVFMFIGLCSVVVQAFLVGPISKRFSETQMLLSGLLLCGIGLFSLPFFQGNLFFPFEYIALALISLANGLINPSMMSIITKRCKPDEIGSTTGVYQSFGSLGRVIGPFIGGGFYGLWYILPYIGGPILLIIALVLLFTQMKTNPKMGIAKEK
ncbi:MAG: MFS transporter [Flavobacteriales bacterium]|nr:MFS transporter [Flavobacteriales bacterium]